ncbi:MAG: hypothetical protein O7D32_10085 [bacterium]|nr:hypothetical protein [bacterium]
MAGQDFHFYSTFAIVVTMAAVPSINIAVVTILVVVSIVNFLRVREKI